MSLKDTIKRLIGRETERMWTCALGKILKVNSPLTCNVEVMIRSKAEPIILKEVPIAANRFGDSITITKPAQDDIVMVVFTKYNFNTTYTQEEKTSIDARKFHISNAFIISGLYTLPNEDSDIENLNPGEILMKHKSGSYLKFDKDGNLYLHANKIYMTET